MFSIEYFKYLIKSKRYLILLIGLVTLLNIVGSNSSDGVYIQSLLSATLCYLLPVYIFYYVHDKKAVDTFFSIPVSRKAMLISGVVFIIGLIYIPLSITIIVHTIRKVVLISDVLLFLIKVLLAISSVVVFVSAIYLLANNAIDGIIMLGAYSFLPIMAAIVIDSFLRVYTCGPVDFNLQYIGYLSPAFMAGDIIVSNISNVGQLLNSSIGLLVYLIIFSISLYLSYTNRKVERANTISNNLFTYPFIITIYLFLVLVLISSSGMYTNIFEQLKDYFVLYLVLFAIFISANFLYKRKLHFTIVLPILYVVAILFTLMFAMYARNTRGFGLSDAYIKDNRNTFYQMNSWQNTPDIDKDIKDLLFEQSKKNSEYVSINVRAGDADLKFPISSEAVNILEKFRQESIDWYYSDNYKSYDYNNNIYVISKENNNTKHYSYYLNSEYTLKDLLDFVDSGLEVTLSNEYGEYKLLKDGSLEVLYEYE